MAIKELRQSREWVEERNRRMVTRVYDVDTGYANLAVLEGPAIGNLFPGSTYLRVSSKHASPIGHGHSELRIVYEWHAQDNQNVNANVQEFDTTAQTTHLTVDANGNPIGGNLEGVDVFRPNWIHKETWWFNAVTNAYVTTLYGATGTINLFAWKLWAAYTMLFLGAVGRRMGVQKWRVDYTFMFRPVQTLFAGGVPVGFTSGWDYVWNDFAIVEGAGADAGKLIYVQGDNHIATVYATSPFVNIGIGV